MSVLFPDEQYGVYQARDLLAELGVPTPDGMRTRGLLDTIERLDALCVKLLAERDSPETADFARGVQLETAHQRERWTATDPEKTPPDWFWLVGYLAGKALHSHLAGDFEKARHHAITTAAACANWHRTMIEATPDLPR